MTIRFRLFLVVAVIGGIGLYFLVDWIKEDLRPRYLATMEESMVETADLLGSLVSEQMTTPELPVGALREIFQGASKRKVCAQIYELTKSENRLNAYVVDLNGVCIFDSGDSGNEGQDFSKWNDVIRTLRGEYGARSSDVVPDDPATSNLYVAAPILFDGEIAGVLTVYKPASSINLFLATAKHKIAAAGLLACLAMVITGFVSTFWIARPMQKLTQYAHAVRDGENPKLPALGQTEMGMLGRAFEEMRDALEGKEYIENYIQTLTHEMKSPLAAIRGAAELLDEEMPREQRSMFMGNIRSETGRLEDLVKRLLELASLEKRKGLKDIEAIDLSDMLRDIVSSMKSQADAKKIQIHLDLNEGVVRGERFLLRQAVENLVQNALDFSTVNGSISVSVTQERGLTVISIHDTGPGIPDYALGKVFDRFYSLERPATRKKSTGLGLSFVREVAELHNGEVTVDNREQSGVIAVLKLPQAVAPFHLSA